MSTNTRAKICKKKQVYKSNKLAKKAVRFHKTINGFTLFSYKCDVCAKYHLTSQPVAQLRKI